MNETRLSPDDLATRFIDSPALAVLLIAVALTVASLVVRRYSLLRRTQVTVEATRQHAIDGLRGIAGMSVVIHHTVITWFFLHSGVWALPPSRFVAHLGQSSVALFFMITAFLFWGRVLAQGSRTDWAGLLVSRLYRLYPVYLVMLGLVVTAAMVVMRSNPAGSGLTAGSLVDWLLFTMFATPDLNGLPRTGLLVAGATWSLRYEWLFYLSLPLLAFVAGRCRRPIPAAVSLIVVLALFQSMNWRGFDPRILMTFSGGFLAAHAIRIPGVLAVCRTTLAGGLAVSALVLVIALTPTAYGWRATIGLSGFFVVIAAGNDLWGILGARGLRWIGDITYPIYLLHGFCLWLVFQRLLPHPLATDWRVFLAASVGVVVVLIAFGSLIFVWVERPAILLGKRHYRRLGFGTAASNNI